jgi:thiamine transport system substrate-binding protein
VNPRKLFWLPGALALAAFVAAFARWTLLGRDIPREKFAVPAVRVLAYEAFSGVAGPGPALARLFEQSCRCKVELLSAGDAGLLLEKMRLAGDSLGADAVVGLDELLLPQARRSFKWRALGPEFAAVPWEDAVKAHVAPDFIPFDWAPLTFIYRKGELEPPAAPRDLAASRFRGAISLMDPRTSTPGLQFLLATDEWAGEGQLASFLRGMKPSIHSVSPSWSGAYGLFQRRQTKMTWSYVTSLVYHWVEEKDRGYQAVTFKEGHPVQVEFAGIPDSCRQCGLAADFLKFLAGPEAQRLNMMKNYMFPARSGLLAGTVFAELPALPRLNAGAWPRFLARKDEKIKLFAEALK